MNAKFFYWLSDTMGCVCGVIVSSLLLAIIFKNTSKSTIAFSRMLVATAVYDIFFCTIEFLTQHQLLIKNGAMIMVPKGVEKDFPISWYPIFFIPHNFSSLLALYILPSQYQYRYALLTEPQKVTGYTLLRNLFFTLGMAVLCAFIGLAGLTYSVPRGQEFYIQQLDPYWATEGLNTYMYALDTRDFFSMMYFIAIGVMNVVYFLGAMYYVYKILKFMGVRNKEMNVSEKTKKLQTQFTRVIIIQGVSSFFFAFIPICVMSLATVCRVGVESVGGIVLMPLSWLSFVNSMFSLCLVKKYRRTLGSWLTCGAMKKKPEGQTTVTQISDFKSKA